MKQYLRYYRNKLLLALIAPVIIVGAIVWQALQDGCSIQIVSTISLAGLVGVIISIAFHYYFDWLPFWRSRQKATHKV